MSGSWWTKSASFLVAALVSALLLIPTFYQSQLIDGTAPSGVRILHDLFRGAHITWGLDLQGGLHLQYQVDVEKALSNKLDRYRDEIARSIQENHPGAQFDVERLRGERALRIRATGANPRTLVDLDELARLSLVAADEAGGGLRLTLDDAFVEETRRYAVDQAIETIRKRIDTMGVAEPSISRRGDTDIIVQLPGLDESAFEETKAIIAQTAQLEFQIVSRDSSDFLSSADVATIEGLERVPGQLPRSQSIETLRTAYASVEPPIGTTIGFEKLERFNQATGTLESLGYQPILLETRSDLTGEYISRAIVANDPQTNWPVVSLEFDAQGARLFGRLTTEYEQRQMAIVLDGVVFSAPNINEPILGGRAQITMGRSGSYQQTFAEAEALTIVLRNGALPAPIEKQFETQVGPSLGRDSIRAGAISLSLGFSLVMIFMLFYYRLAGIVSVVSLILNVLFIGSILAILGATLTLPGIAGITLTIGMAVDANVLIFERIKEEIGKGVKLRQAVEAGYAKALSAVLDANITTGIAGIVLLEFGSGPVKGFAVTLLIGIVSSLLTAVVASRLLFDFLVEKGVVERGTLGGAR
jgi:preprotein translocase subunit SecD